MAADHEVADSGKGYLKPFAIYARLPADEAKEVSRAQAVRTGSRACRKRLESSHDLLLGGMERWSCCVRGWWEVKILRGWWMFFPKGCGNVFSVPGEGVIGSDDTYSAFDVEVS